MYISFTFFASCFSVFRGLDFSSPWRETFSEAKKSIAENLHILHYSMQTILGVCQGSNYANLLIVDLSKLR